MVDRAAGGDGRRGVVTRDQVHGDPPPFAHGGRRFANRREQRGVEPDGVDQLVRPLPGGEIEQARRTGAGALTHDLAGEMVHEQLGEHEHVRGARELRAVVRGELEDRVERERREAADRVETILPDVLDDVAVPVRARVAVRHWWLQQVTVPAEQPVVDAPGVDADRGDWSDRTRRVEAALHPGDQTIPVPAHDVTRARVWRVRVAVHDGEHRWARVEIDAADPDRRRAEVDRDHGRAQSGALQSPVASEVLPRSATIAAR